MKKTLQLSTLLLLSLALCALALNAAPADPSELVASCGFGSNPETGHCYTGMVTFSGTGYPHNVDVTVTNITDPENPVVIDDAKYTASQGNLEFTQTLFPAGTYEVVAGKDKGKGAVYATLTITVDGLP